MKSRFSLALKDVRAVKEAEIDLNGITVLSGENGCGKTTIAKLLYVFLKTSVNYNSVVFDLFSSNLSFPSSLLSDFIPRKKKDDLFSDADESDLFDIRESIPHISDSTSFETYISDVFLPKLRLIKQKYEEQEYFLTNIAFSRLVQLYERRVEKTNAKNVIELLNDYETYVLSLLQEISNLRKTHSLNIFSSQITKYFNEDTTKWNYTFKEFDSNLIEKKSKSVILQKSFSDVIYIDVPTVFDSDFYRPSSRFYRPSSRNFVILDLQDMLVNARESIENDLISSAIEDSLKGKISRNDNMFSKIFVYTAKNGQTIPLSQAASGLKCFAVLERLYANGCLREDSMLIVDEPEVHLHPRWIVEYARVLVLIQKYLHTTILIASHNPDMISAIKYISEKESISDSLAFYIAEEIDSDGFGKYKFKNLGTDIEDIFSSFNIALDRINQYGAIDAE